MRPGSECRACRRALAAADLVPVLSYLQRRGRCRYCGAKIGPHLLAVELGAAAAFAALPLWLGSWAGVVAALGILAAAVALAGLAGLLVR